MSQVERIPSCISERPLHLQFSFRASSIVQLRPALLVGSLDLFQIFANGFQASFKFLRGIVRTLDVFDDMWSDQGDKFRPAVSVGCIAEDEPQSRNVTYQGNAVLSERFVLGNDAADRNSLSVFDRNLGLNRTNVDTG